MINQLFPRAYADWDTEPSAPRRRPAALTLVEVQVQHVKDNGFKTDAGSWLNWSKFADASQVLMPRTGDVVRVGLDKSGFIRQLAIVGPNGEAQPAARAPIAGGSPAVQLAATTIAALAATRKPEPPEFEAEPDWMTTQPGAPAQPERVVLSGSIEQDPRGTIITRLAVLNTATAILSSGGGAATIEEVLELAGQLEDWATR